MRATRLATRERIAVLGAVAGALLFTAACPPHERSLLGWLAPGVFLVPLARLAPWRASLCGLLFGTVWGATMAAWMREASLAYFAFNDAAAVGFVFAVAIVYAGIPNAALGAAYAAVAGRVGPTGRAFVGAWLWTASELLRTHVFTGLPWELLGHTQFATLPVIQIADLGGPYAVSFVMALVGIALIDAAVDGLRTPPTATALGRRLVPATAVLAATLAYGLWSASAHAAAADGEERTVAVVQGNLENVFRWKREYFERNLLVYARLTARARRAAPDLIVWPENAVNFYLEREPTLGLVLRSAAAEAREGLVVGGPRLGSTGHSHNAAYLLDPDGRVRGAYDKQHLLPFAEYDPVRPAEPAPLAGPIAFAPGEERGLLDTGRSRLGTLICYEMLFPALVRERIARGAELLVNISNDSWLDDGSGAAPRQHFSMVVFAAVATRRYLVRASASGVSGIVSPTGAVSALLPRATEGTATGTVRLLDGTTPYVWWGDSWILVGGMLGVAVIAQRREREQA